MKFQTRSMTQLFAALLAASLFAIAIDTSLAAGPATPGDFATGNASKVFEYSRKDGTTYDAPEIYYRPDIDKVLFDETRWSSAVPKPGFKQYFDAKSQRIVEQISRDGETIVVSQDKVVDSIRVSLFKNRALQNLILIDGTTATSLNPKICEKIGAKFSGTPFKALAEGAELCRKISEPQNGKGSEGVIVETFSQENSGKEARRFLDSLPHTGAKSSFSKLKSYDPMIAAILNGKSPAPASADQLNAFRDLSVIAQACSMITESRTSGPVPLPSMVTPTADTLKRPAAGESTTRP